ncbi:MAG TPA: YibE/F family protein [Candidatus Limnocylindrales bacterium]|nr:YibE/F family protein [Candidatus Limnocylindrales bacterium]
MSRRRSGGPGAPWSGEATSEAEDGPAGGLRRNARAIFGGLALLLLVGLLPDLTPPSSEPPPVVLVHARIVELVDTAGEPGVPDAVVEVLSGPDAGTRREAYLQGPSGQQEVPRYEVGDEVILNISQQGQDAAFVAVADRFRVPALAALVGLFALAVTFVGGWRGIRSLLALALTLAVVIRIVVPLLLAGWDPVPLAVISASLVTLATFLLTEGARPTTVAAAAGTFLALALTALLAVAFNALARFTELQGSGDLVYLQTVGRPELDLGGLLLAAVIFGALGILDDVTVTQAATVHELYEADPDVGRLELFRRAMNVGRSHIAATVNTLALAYVGASLPLIVLFNAGQQDPFLTASGEIVAVEIVKALVGSIGITAAVPATTAMAVLLVGRHVPLLDRPERPPGWT